MFRWSRILLAALGVALAALFPPSAAAQNQDFSGLVRSALFGNEQLVTQIQAAQAPGDLAAVKAKTAPALTTSEQVEGWLTKALPMAPDDASRSRVEGVLQHIKDTTAALRQTAPESTVDAAFARLDQGRGEAVEALSELKPFAEALPVPQPTQLPRGGGLDSAVLAVTAALGAALGLGGLGMRLRLGTPGALAAAPGLSIGQPRDAGAPPLPRQPVGP